MLCSWMDCLPSFGLHFGGIRAHSTVRALSGVSSPEIFQMRVADVDTVRVEVKERCRLHGNF